MKHFETAAHFTAISSYYQTSAGRTVHHQVSDGKGEKLSSRHMTVHLLQTMMINKIDTSPIALDEVMSGNTAQEPGPLFSKTSIGRCHDSKTSTDGTGFQQDENCSIH